jgi:hypothetical protein
MPMTLVHTATVLSRLAAALAGARPDHTWLRTLDGLQFDIIIV